MSKAKFEWRNTYRAPAISADEAHKELERIRKTHNALRPEDVVAEAIDPNSMLHCVFEWDDAVCGEQFRRQQAQRLIRAIVRVENDEAPQHREYTLVTSREADKTEYMPTEVVAKDADLFADALARLEGEVSSARRAVQELEAVARTVSAEPERMAKIALASKALETAAVAVAALH